MFIVSINVFILSESGSDKQKILLYSFIIEIVIGISTEFDYICGKNTDKTILTSLRQIFTNIIGRIATSYFMYYLQEPENN